MFSDEKSHVRRLPPLVAGIGPVAANSGISRRAGILGLALLTLTSAVPIDAQAAGNKKPKANPGTPQSVNEQTQVSLNGSTSSDADGTIASYLWEQTAGSAVSLSGATSAQASFTAPTVKKVTKLAFKLTVTDNQGATASKPLNITVKPVNTAPVANAGSNQNVALGASVTLNGSASTDSDGEIVKYQWKQTQGTKVKLSSTSVASPTFTAPAALKSGVQSDALGFTLTVTDDEKAKTTSTPVTVTVGGNAAAQLAGSLTLNASTVTLGTAVSATASVSGGKTPYSVVLNWGDNSQSTTATASHTYAAAGSYTVTLTVTDANGASATSSKTVTVTSAATAALTASFDLNGSTPAILAGDTLTARAQSISGGTGPYKVKYEWGDGSSAEQYSLASGVATKSASHTYATLGNYTLKITVTDANNATKTYTVTVDVQAANPLGEC